MTTGIIDTRPLFRASADVHVDVPPDAAYALVSGLENSSLWSPECRGGTWTGEPGRVGSVFRGENYRSPDVVGWAPLVRGTWFTEAEVIVAEPARTFQWTMLTHTGTAQRSVWGFDVEPAGTGCLLRHHFEMTEATEGIHHIVADLDEEARGRFVGEWSDKIQDDIEVTLVRIKEILEQGVHDGSGATMGAQR